MLSARFFSLVLFILLTLKWDITIGQVRSGQEWTYQVYDQLTRAAGHPDGKRPRLVTASSEAKWIARFDGTANTITIYQSTIDVCETFGTKKQDALAFIIGHEFKHFLEGEFQSAFYDEKFSDEKRKKEAEADISGAFLARLANFEINSIVESLLEKLYDAHQISKERSTGYPSLQERQNMALQGCSRAQELADIYLTGNLLLATNRPDQAASCYQYLIREVTFKELYNNLAIAQLLAVRNLKGDPYYYPFTVDAQKRFRNSGRYTETALLQAAFTNLDRAISIDNRYHPAFINKACAAALSGDLQRAEVILNSLEEIPTSTITKQRALLLRGILAAKGNKPEAREIFQKMAQQANDPSLRYFGSNNLNIVEGKRIPRTRWNNSIPKIDGISLGDYQPGHTSGIVIDNKDSFSPQKFYRDKSGSSSLYTYEIEAGNRFLKYQLTASRLTPSVLPILSEPVAMGTSFEKLYKEIRSEMHQLVHFEFGGFIILPNHKLIIEFDQWNTITQWGTYF